MADLRVGRGASREAPAAPKPAASSSAAPQQRRAKPKAVAMSSSRLMSMRDSKDASALFRFDSRNAEDLLASAYDLPSMRGVPDQLRRAKPRPPLRRYSCVAAERLSERRNSGTPPKSHTAPWTPATSAS